MYMSCNNAAFCLPHGDSSSIISSNFAFRFYFFTPIALPRRPTLTFAYVIVVLAFTNFLLSVACLVVFPTLTTTNVYPISSSINGFIFYLKLH